MLPSDCTEVCVIGLEVGGAEPDIPVLNDCTEACSIGLEDGRVELDVLLLSDCTEVCSVKIEDGVLIMVDEIALLYVDFDSVSGLLVAGGRCAIELDDVGLTEDVDLLLASVIIIKCECQGTIIVTC